MTYAEVLSTVTGAVLILAEVVTLNATTMGALSRLTAPRFLFVPGALCLAALSLALPAGCASAPKRSEPIVRKLDIQGNTILSDRQIQKKILTSKTGWWPFAKMQLFDPVIWASDLRRIKRLYGSRGYYQAEVTHDSVKALPHDGVALEVVVREGAPTHIAALDVEGLDALDASARGALLSGLPLTVGAVFKEDDWTTAKQSLRTALRNRGYEEVDVDGVARIDVGTQMAKLQLLVRLGELYRFGAIQIDTGGDTIIQASWIWEQVRIAISDGQVYSDDALEEAQRRVSGMGVFAEVKVTAGVADTATGLIPVRVETREAPLRTLKLGGGVRIDQIRNEGRLIGEWTHRDFLGGMRRLTAHAEAGWAFIPNTYAVLRKDQTQSLRNGPIVRLRLNFEQPRFLGRPSLRERSAIGLTRTLEQTYNDLGGQLVNGVVWQPRAAVTIYPSHHLQGDQLDGPPGAGVLTAPLTLGCHTTNDSCFVWLSYLEEVATWDRRDNTLEPRNGWYASLSLQQGGGPLLGDFNYYRLLPEVRGYVSLGDDDELTFAARLQVGELFPTSGDPRDSAVITRFYGGGGQSMRGFNARRLSPLIETQLPTSPGAPNPPIVTVPIGGNGLVDGSFEVRYSITSNLLLAAFVDVGQVTVGRLQPADLAHVLVAVGFGFRYLTLVGPIRVDFGRRLQVGRPPPLFKVDAAGRIVAEPYQVDDSCFGIGGSGRSVVTDNLCVLHLSIGEAF